MDLIDFLTLIFAIIVILFGYVTSNPNELEPEEPIKNNNNYPTIGDKNE